MRTAMTVFISVAVLQGGMMPPAFRHAHGGGESSHEHRDDSRAARSHHHGHEHPHRHPHAADESTPSNSLATRHVHVFFFGMEFSLPCGVPGPLQGDESGDGGDEAVTLVRLVDVEGLAAIDARCERALDDAQSRGIVAIVDARSGLQGDGNARHSHPLCDIARGARSGVLLV